jgi:hypothetical protein
MTASTFMLGGEAAFAPKYIFEREARFQITEPALKELAAKKASDQTPIVPVEVIKKLEPWIGERRFTVAELEQFLKDDAKLEPAEITRSNESIYEALPSPDSIKLSTINLIFGVIVVIAGLLATLSGGILGDKLRDRIRGAYFVVAGAGCLAAFPCFLAMLYVPFPYAWGLMFLAVFGLFFNTGPANTILANVVPSSIRASSFAINILIIHAFGDVISPPIIGVISSFSSLQHAFLVTSFFILIAGIVWTMGARHLDRDTRNAEPSALGTTNKEPEKPVIIE